MKNYWNTHIQPRSKQQKIEPDADELLQDAPVTIIHPQQYTTMSKTQNLSTSDKTQIVSNGGGNLISSLNEGGNNFNVSSVSPNVLLDDKIKKYLDELFDDREMEIEGDIEWSFGESSAAQAEALNAADQEEDNNGLFDFSLDEIMWNSMDSQQL